MRHGSALAWLAGGVLAGCAGGASNAPADVAPADATLADSATAGDPSAEPVPAIDQAVTSTIEPGGGTVTLEGIASATFPAGAFGASHPVRLEQTNFPATAQAFDDSAGIFQPGGPLGYEIRINTGDSAPSTPVEASIRIPATFAVPDGFQAEAFAQFLEGGDQDSYDHFEWLASTVDAAAGVLTTTVPPEAFASSRRADGTFEAIVTVAPTPGVTAPVAAGSTASALGTDGKILPPLAALQVRSPFDANRKVTVKGVLYVGHWGVDFVAASGTPIFASGDGTVLRAFDSGADSFGNCIVLRLAGGGAVTYAHLQSYDVKKGEKVLAGQEIGLTDNTGLTQGPHLHFEFVPDGQYLNKKSKVDPVPAIEDRDLTWRLTTTAVFDSKSLIPGVTNEYHLKLSAEADLLMKSDGPGAMTLTVTAGTVTVDSYTGSIDQGSGTICTYRSSPQTFALVTDATPGAMGGATVGGASLVTDATKSPSVRFGYTLWFFSNDNAKYTESCPGSPDVDQPIVLTSYPWINVDASKPYYLDPESPSITDHRLIDSSVPGYQTNKATYDWTLEKKY